ncbi:MAG: hypothetical protein Q9184_003074, partial [Pyrenodesmia sp. 2 TL-2023]
MRRPEHNTTALPRSLREELGIQVETLKPSQGKRTIPGLRKDQRKAARTEKKTKSFQRNPNASREYHQTSVPSAYPKGPSNPLGKPSRTLRIQDEVKHVPSRSKSVRTAPQVGSSSEGLESDASPPQRPRNLSRGVKDKLAAEDAEIAALEKALGVKGKKKLPKSFEDDGLDVLLDGLGDGLEDTVHTKRKRDEGEEWLEAKRKKARKANREAEIVEDVSLSEIEGDGDSFDGLSDIEGDLEIHGSSASSHSDDDDLDVEDRDESTSATESRKPCVRENPYRAPVTSAVAAPKYVPPSLRNRLSSETEDLSRLRRQVQGLINRLSEANMLSILGDVESLYRNNARQHVSSVLLDLLLGILSDPSPLQDTFIILHAGFLVSLYKVIGSDFGAQVVQRIDDEFRLNYEQAPDDPSKGKKLVNLTILVSQLYTFQMVGSSLMYDYIKLFAKDLSEETAELLLRCVRSAGSQLRQDDPSALKEIVLLVHNAVSRLGESNLSVRTKFMIETINNLKNNRMKTGIAASEVLSEHVIRMKKTLGSLNTRNIKASEPLRIGLRDIREADKRGKWWLVGASYKEPAEDAREDMAFRQGTTSQGHDDLIFAQDAGGDLLQLAREQRMNTDVRRSIFVAIMSATDYNDAFQRLMKLRLKKSQELEIPKVIIHCAGAETGYNPYYTLLARRVCSDRKLKMAFQFSLWDLFKRMGEGVDDDENERDKEDDEKLGTRSIVNLAKMFGTLIAEGGLSLNVLKVGTPSSIRRVLVLNLAYLQPKARNFVELLVITIILRSQKGTKASRDEESITEVFIQVKDNPQMAKGLQYFLKKTVSKTDIAGSKADIGTVKWGCRVAGDALDVFRFQTCSVVFTMIRSLLSRATSRSILGPASRPLAARSAYSIQQPKYYFFSRQDRGYATEAEVGDVKLNLKQMMAAKDTSVQGLTKGVEFLFKKNNVEYVRGTGALAGEHEVRVNKIEGGEATYLAKNILIATGSEATPFPGLTIDEKKVVTSTGAIALDQVPKKMVVIGGGIIGLEMGSVWCRLGADVTVVEYLGQIGGPGMDAEISKTTQKILGKQGMKFKLNTKVVSGDDSGEGVKLEVEAAKGGKKETLDADVVLVAIGRRPYTAGLGLENAGLDVDNKGRIVIDEQYRTKVPHIRVIGDCTFGPMLAHKAEEEAVAAIEYITKGHGHVNYGAIPSVMYTHPEVAWVGQNESELKEQGIKYR